MGPTNGLCHQGGTMGDSQGHAGPSSGGAGPRCRGLGLEDEVKVWGLGLGYDIWVLGQGWGQGWD